MGVLDGTKANSAPNLVGVGAGAELGNSKLLIEWLNDLCYGYIVYYAVRYCQMLYNIVTYCQISSNIIEYCINCWIFLDNFRCRLTSINWLQIF